VFVLGSMMLTLDYQLVFPIAMYESHYIGSLDPLEPYELD